MNEPTPMNASIPPVVTVALIPSYDGEPSEAQLRSVLQQTWPRMELIILSNGARDFDMDRVTRDIMYHQTQIPGCTGRLIRAFVWENETPLANNEVFSQLLDMATGDYLLPLLQDEVLSGDVLSSAMTPLADAPDAPFAGCLMPITDVEGQTPLFFDGLPLVTGILPPDTLRRLSLDDGAPTLRLALSYRLNQLALPVFQVKDDYIGREFPCPVDDYALFSGQCNHTAGQSLRRYLAKARDGAQDPRALHALTADMSRTLSRRLERARHGYWAMAPGEALYLSLLETLGAQIDALLSSSGDTAREAILQGMDALDLYVQKAARPQIKILFVAQESEVWPSLHCAYLHCAQDPRFEAQVVYLPFADEGPPREQDMRFYRERGIPAVAYPAYDIVYENPDVAVFVKAYDTIPMGYRCAQISHIVDRIAYIPYHISLFGSWAPEAEGGLDMNFSSQPIQTVATHFVIDSPGLARHTAKNNLRRGANLLCIGHPRMDLYRSEAKKTELPPMWQRKLADRKVFLYNPHHSEEHSTFWRYHEALLDYVMARDDIALILRPHLLLKARFRSRGELTRLQWFRLARRIARSENVILDEGGDYILSFQASDALITDISSLLIEYMFLNQPLMVLSNPLGDGRHNLQLFNQELIAGAAQAHSLEEIIAFMEEVVAGEDPSRTDREAFLRNSLYGYGENVSMRFADALYSDIAGKG